MACGGCEGAVRRVLQSLPGVCAESYPPYGLLIMMLACQLSLYLPGPSEIVKFLPLRVLHLFSCFARLLQAFS